MYIVQAGFQFEEYIHYPSKTDNMTSWKEDRPEQDTDKTKRVVSSSERDEPPQPNGDSKGAMTTCPWLIHPQVDESSLVCKISSGYL